MVRVTITEKQFEYLKCFVKVCHMKDSSKYLPIKYDDWTDFWKSKMLGKQFPDSESLCPCCTKIKTNFVGCHVVITYDIDKKDNPNSKIIPRFYICPVCKSCNSRAANDEDFRTTEFIVLKEMLVPVYDGEYEIIEENHSK